MSFVGSNILAGASGQGGGGYEIERSLRFNAPDSSYLSRTPSSAGNLTTWTMSVWVKNTLSFYGTSQYPALFGADDYSGSRTFLRYQSTGTWEFFGSGNRHETLEVYRDPSAWYHLVLKWDTTNSTAADRVILYINGVRQTWDGTFTANATCGFNANVVNLIGKEGEYARYINAYLADYYFIDGQALAPTDFGETDDNGVWQPKKFAGSYTLTATTTSLSQTGWTTSGTYSESNIWDGNTSTPANGHNGGVIGSVSFNPPLTNVTKVELYTQNYNHYLNGSQISTSQSSTGWHTYYDNSSSSITLNSVGNAYTNNTQTVDLMAIRINGTIVNAQTWTPPSGVGLALIGANSFHLDFKDNSSNAALGNDAAGSNNWTVNNFTAVVNKESANWPAMTTGSAFNSANSIDKAFDGSDSNGSAPAAGTAFVFTPSTAITGISKVRIRALRDASQFDEHDFKLNGTNIGGSWSLNSTASVEFTVNNLTSLLWATKSNSQWYKVYKIEIYYGGSYKTLVTNTAGAASIDSLVDTPNNGTQTDTGIGGEVVGNYATLNPLAKSSNFVTTNGNLAIGASGGVGACLATIAYPKSGKWYHEIVFDSVPGYNHVGIARDDTGLTGNPGYDTTRQWTYWQNGNKTNNQGYGSSYTGGDVIGIAFDADAGSLTFYKNGTSQGVNATGLTSTTYNYFPYFPCFTFTANINFGQRAFAHPLSGYKSLNTVNLPEPTIADGRKYFDTKLWTGTGVNPNNITGLSFSPDWVWIKQRSGTRNNAVYDTIRGVTKELFPDETSQENTLPSGLTSFNPDGFTVSTNSRVNQASNTYVGWAWDAGSSTVSNTAGSIASQVRANPSAGFSIVSYTGGGGSGATVGHGLNSKPELIILKSRTAAENWFVNYPVGTGDGYLMLNQTNAGDGSNGTVWNSTAPTSSVFTLGSSSGVNGSQNYIAYCFSPVEGYSAMGSYTGNGSADGVFVHTGFKIAWLMVKRTDATNDWVITDGVRNTSNVVDKGLYADITSSESTATRFDFVSNGFKIRNTLGEINASGGTYIYLAFAEHPFKTARAR